MDSYEEDLRRIVAARPPVTLAQLYATGEELADTIHEADDELDDELDWFEE